MRTLRKTDIESMAMELQVLENSDQMKIAGGINYLAISGGSLIQLSDGVMFVPTEAGWNSGSGNTVFFSGVSMSTSSVANNTAYQMNGTIHISSNWAANGFSLCDFAHEYGHYLQQQDMGWWDYITGVAAESAWSVLWNDSATHNQQSYEMDATNRGNAYISAFGYCC